jgi:Raf kinase inhibitor-like YbhB/YbcL family protein
MPLAITSPAFQNDAVIPVRFTRDGENLSPPLEWQGAPPETLSFVLVIEDPDAPSGTFWHWAIYNISPQDTGLPEGTSGPERGAAEGANGFGHAHYDGPQPPKGHGTHHYHFRLAALNVPRLELGGAVKAEAVWAAARPHIVAEAELVGVYKR